MSGKRTFRTCNILSREKQFVFISSFVYTLVCVFVMMVVFWWHNQTSPTSSGRPPNMCHGNCRYILVNGYCYTTAFTHTVSSSLRTMMMMLMVCVSVWLSAVLLAIWHINGPTDRFPYTFMPATNKNMLKICFFLKKYHKQTKNNVVQCY